MLFVKRNDIFLYTGSIVLCAITYTVLNKNTELALLPHKTVLEYLFNFNFVYMENVGYEQTNGLFTISQNCLGGKLYISLFSIMTFGFLHKYPELKYKITAVIKFYFTAVILAFVITIIRITASVPFCTWERFYLIHTVISLGIYFAAGLTLYFAMERRLRA